MRLIITNNEDTIGVSKNFEGMNHGLIGQTITELEILKRELIELYEEGGSA